MKRIRGLTFLSVFWLLLLAPFVAQSQEKITINIETYDHKPPEGAHLLVYADSTFQNTLYTRVLENEKKISFELPDSIPCFYLWISHLEYEHIQQNFCKPFSKEINITLQENLNQLDEVTIEGFKDTKVTIQGNKAELRLGKIMEENIGLTATTVAKSLPEVFILPGNRILLRGHEVHKIYLHSGSSSTETEISFSRLESIDAKEIDRIVADYLKSDIHVYLKKEKPGYSFDNTLRFTQGKKFYASYSPKFKIKKGKTYYSLENSIGWTHQNPSGNSNYKLVLPDESNQIVETNGLTNHKLKYFNTELFIEHEFDSTYTGGMKLNYALNENLEKNFSRTVINHTESSDATLRDDGNSYSVFPSLYLEGKYSRNWKMSANVGWFTSLQKFVDKGNFDYVLEDKPTHGFQNLKQRIHSNAYAGTLKSEKTWNATTVSVKLKNTYLESKVNSGFQQNLLVGAVIDSTFANQIKENRFELETDLKTTLWTKYLLSLSSNFLFYDYKYENENSDNATTNSVFKWLPGLSISIPLKEDKYLTLFGSSFFKAPNFSNVVFRSLSQDGFINNENNETLKPYATYQFGASYSLFENLNSTISWSKTDNMIMIYPDFADNGSFNGSRKINLSNSYTTGLSLFYSNAFFKRIFLSANANLNHVHWDNKGDYPFSENYFSALGNVSVYYSTKTHWSLNVDYTYSSPQKLSDKVLLKSYSLLNLNVSKQLGKYWALFCDLNNVLDTYRLKIYSEDVPYNSYNNPDEFYVTLGIKYKIEKRFKKKKNKKFMEDLEKRTTVEVGK